MVLISYWSCRKGSVTGSCFFIFRYFISWNFVAATIPRARGVRPADVSQCWSWALWRLAKGRYRPASAIGARHARPQRQQARSLADDGSSLCRHGRRRCAGERWLSTALDELVADDYIASNSTYLTCLANCCWSWSIVETVHYSLQVRWTELNRFLLLYLHVLIVSSTHHRPNPWADNSFTKFWPPLTRP